MVPGKSSITGWFRQRHPRAGGAAGVGMELHFLEQIFDHLTLGQDRDRPARLVLEVDAISVDAEVPIESREELAGSDTVIDDERAELVGSADDLAARNAAARE